MFYFKLVSPDRVLIDEDVASASLPTAEGEITVLPHHAPLAALLVPGVIRVVRSKGEEDVAVSGGFIHVNPDNQVMVLADTAERGHELELSVIEQAKQRAAEVMKQAAQKDDVSFAAAAAALERELARYKVATKHRRAAGLPASEQTAIKEEENAS